MKRMILLLTAVFIFGLCGFYSTMLEIKTDEAEILSRKYNLSRLLSEINNEIARIKPCD